MKRHFGMDWLRIGAFGLLIFYHIGMVFVPWDFHVKTAHPMSWVAIPMMAANSWRLMLLFVISGYASRALFSKGTGLAGFIGSRSKRLLIPLLFGIIVVVPVQPWIELVVKYHYPHGFGWFWLHDFFGFHRLKGIALPTWQHLWFVGYLWFYTLVLTVLIALLGWARLQRVFDALFGTGLVVLLPIAWLISTDMLLPGASETHDPLHDTIAHLHYLPAFLFGFGLAGSERAMAAIARWWKAALGVALIAYVVVAGIEWTWPGSAMPGWPWGTTFAVARVLHGWCSVIALIGIADRYWNYDNRWRPVLTEAVFPFYIIHQTVIVLVEFWLLPLRAGPLVEFLVLVPATVAGCWGFYLIGREIGWLRPLIGLRAKPRKVTA
ncbi:acyltransferase family protein [Sphingomonas immobilis]|uniref:Acyltransferase family protein n=1 Tax=Sphingomonas immobilis TaxID=3063997 RepID=A0ABT9A287_9SPHN|nr:acyltransferase family protein [Sphingomonas sp. CA1-15]MDO7843945.1 acyltransferase family protein [Sphingomonas sp. CA1-15]